jgi:hypothetical protein
MSDGLRLDNLVLSGQKYPTSSDITIFIFADITIFIFVILNLRRCVSHVTSY